MHKTLMIIQFFNLFFRQFCHANQDLSSQIAMNHNKLMQTINWEFHKNHSHKDPSKTSITYEKSF